MSNTLTDQELGVILYKHKCWVESDGKKGEQADLTRFNLSERELSNVNLEGAKLNGAIFYKANLRGANLKKATLKGACFNEANLSSADLSYAILKFAQLKGACCTWTNFTEANLFRANFDSTEINRTNFIESKTGDKSLEKLLETAKVTSIVISLPKEKETFDSLDSLDSFDSLNNSLSNVDSFTKNQDKSVQENIDEIDEDIEKEVTTKSLKEQVQKFNPIKPSARYNFRFIGLCFGISLVLTVIVSNFYDSKASTKDLNNKGLTLEPPKIENTTDNSQEVAQEQEPVLPEVDYSITLDPNNPEENPTVKLSVGNVTILDLEQIPKEILPGDKEVIEVVKSSSNPKRIYLIGKAPVSNSNIVIESSSGAITLSFEVLENAAGDFNGRVVISSEIENKS